MESIVRLEQVVKEYPLGKLVVRALQGVDLEINRGEFTTIAGPSGSGKTTLLNLVGCVDVATKGVVMVAGQSTGKLNDRALTDLRLHKIGFIFQSFNLISVLTLAQNVEFPLILQGGTTKVERDKRVREMVEKVGLTPQINQRPNELSGGQQQRVAVARALAGKPAILLADEPTGNLDSRNGDAVMALLKELHAGGATICMVTHDTRFAEHADRTIHLFDGRVVEDRMAA